MSALSDALAAPASAKVALVVVDLLERLVLWTDAGGTSWTTTTAHRVVGVRVDGADADAGHWTWDSATGVVTLDEAALGTDADPRHHVVHAVVRLYLSNRPKTFSGVVYRPCVVGVPELSLRVEPRFGDVAQVGGGTVELADDGTLGDLRAIDWDGGECRIYLGADLPRLPT